MRAFVVCFRKSPRSGDCVVSPGGLLNSCPFLPDQGAKALLFPFGRRPVFVSRIRVVFVIPDARSVVLNLFNNLVRPRVQGAIERNCKNRSVRKKYDCRRAKRCSEDDHRSTSICITTVRILRRFLSERLRRGLNRLRSQQNALFHAPFFFFLPKNRNSKGDSANRQRIDFFFLRAILLNARRELRPTAGSKLTWTDWYRMATLTLPRGIVGHRWREHPTPISQRPSGKRRLVRKVRVICGVSRLISYRS